MQRLVSSTITLLVNVNINHVTHTVQRRTPVVFRTVFKRMVFIFTKSQSYLKEFEYIQH
jgi:hypothetical protein